MYLNKFDFLYNSKGIESAAKTYFNKKTFELNLEESATLIGMLENPSLYNPKNNPNKAKKQKNLVLFQMKKYNFINNELYKKLIKNPIKIKFKLQNKELTFFTYYSKFLEKEIKKVLYEYKKKTGKNLNLYSGGLKIYTSINNKMQYYAESSIKKHLSLIQPVFDSLQKKNITAPFSGISKKKIKEIYLSAMKRTLKYKKLKKKGLKKKYIIKLFKKKENLKIFTWNGNKKALMSRWDLIKYKKSIIQAGMVSIEPYTGYIKSWVGGIDFNHFQYDHVAQTKRQVGSIFKPFVYAAAIEKLKYNPCTIISTEKFNYGKWSPKNVDGNYEGYITLKEALAKSVNTVSARLISLISPISVINLAKKLGIKSIIPNNLSIALGSADLTPYEITAAFNTFSNHGIFVKPKILIKIEDKYGKIIKENKILYKKVLSEEISCMMLKLLKGVIEIGTGKSIKTKYKINSEIAGKTGTTNNYSDGWFVGLTPNLTTTVWVGWEDRFTHFQNLKLGQGANMALPIWGYYMYDIYNDKSLKYQKNETFGNPINYFTDWDNCFIYKK